jgi:hypothetical protein
VHHAVLASLNFAGIHSYGSTRINDDHSHRIVRLVSQLGLFLVERSATEVRDPVVQEIVGLSLQGIGPNCDYRVGQLGVLIAVV